MPDLTVLQQPHRRYNPLTGRWILVSPHRTGRPWQGQIEEAEKKEIPEYDPGCYLCPGNTRANNEKNPDYKNTYVFDNDYPALISDIPAGEINKTGLIRAKSEKGICRVICFSPKHDLTLPDMKTEAIKHVIDTWIKQYSELGEKKYINCVQIFENKGAMMGCSNPHPHCQIWATESIPEETIVETAKQKEWKEKNNSCLLCDYLNYENHEKIRLVYGNKSFIAVVPFWAVWPFETLILPVSHAGALGDLDESAKSDLADILKQITTVYDRLFNISFPYSMGIHQRPTDGGEHEEYHFHIHFYPPLLRSASVRKFMVGYELLAEPQRDITAEICAERLRKLRNR